MQADEQRYPRGPRQSTSIYTGTLERMDKWPETYPNDLRIFRNTKFQANSQTLLGEDLFYP